MPIFNRTSKPSSNDIQDINKQSAVPKTKGGVTAKLGSIQDVIQRFKKFVLSRFQSKSVYKRQSAKADKDTHRPLTDYISKEEESTSLDRKLEGLTAAERLDYFDSLRDGNNHSPSAPPEVEESQSLESNYADNLNSNQMADLGDALDPNIVRPQTNEGQKPLELSGEYKDIDMDSMAEAILPSDMPVGSVPSAPPIEEDEPAPYPMPKGSQPSAPPMEEEEMLMPAAAKPAMKKPALASWERGQVYGDMEKVSGFFREINFAVDVGYLDAKKAQSELKALDTNIRKEYKDIQDTLKKMPGSLEKYNTRFEAIMKNIEEIQQKFPSVNHSNRRELSRKLSNEKDKLNNLFEDMRSEYGIK